MVTNVSTAQFQSIKSVDGNLIAYTITYSADFEGTTIMFGIKPSAMNSTNAVLSRFVAKNDTFVALGSNGLLLNAYFYDDYTKAKTLGTASYILGFLFFSFAFVLCYGDWKEIGL